MKKFPVLIFTFSFLLFPLAVPVLAASNLVPATQYFIYKKALELQNEVGNRTPTDEEINRVLSTPDKSMEPKAYTQDGSYYLVTGIDGSVALPAEPGTYTVSVKPVKDYKFNPPQKVVVLADKQNIVYRIGVKVTPQGGVGAALPKRDDVIPASAIAIQLFADYDDDGIQQGNEPNLPWANVQFTLNRQTGSFRYHLTAGWNLVSFPFQKEEFDTAAKLLAAVKLQGGDATTVARFDNGDYEEYVLRTDHAVTNSYGNDFAIEPGRGYFIRNHNDVTVEVFGQRPEQKGTYVLKKGYNLVGLNLLSRMTALQLINLSDKLPSGENAIKTVTQHDSGLLKPLVKEENQVYGFDFPLSAFKGYFLNVREGTKIVL